MCFDFLLLESTPHPISAFWQGFDRLCINALGSLRLNLLASFLTHFVPLDYSVRLIPEMGVFYFFPSYFGRE